MKLIVTTLVPAPLTKVWKAYTSPEDIVNWNTASADWHTTLANVDLRRFVAFFFASLLHSNTYAKQRVFEAPRQI